MGRDTLKTLGASNLTDAERSKLDYYGTDPVSTKALLEVEKFQHCIWEPCAGHHLIAKVLEEAGHFCRTSDIAEYEGYQHEILNFLDCNEKWDGDIITNPPYNIATDIALKALDCMKTGAKLAMFLRLQYLEGGTRFDRLFKENPPKTVYVFVNRQTSSKVDDFSVGSAVAYCWYVWEKGFKGDTIIKWIRTDKKEEVPTIF